MKKYIVIIILLILSIVCLISFNNNNDKDISKEKIVTTFYPLYIMTLNILDGTSDIVLENMTENQGGCLHNYTLQTSDLRKLEKANILIRNGLGLENFMDKITRNIS